MPEAIIKRVLDTVRTNRNIEMISVRGDYGARFINAVIAVDGVPLKVDPSCAVTISAKRFDGQSKRFEGSVNEDGTIKVPITQWMAEIPDTRDECTVTVVGPDTKLSTTPFDVEVFDTPHQDDNIDPDDPEYDVLVQVLQGEASRNAAENERQAAEIAREQAETERKAAEAARSSAELTRGENETSRINAERSREEIFGGWVGSMGDISAYGKRLDVLEAAVYGDLAQEVEDNTVAYVKNVPAGALSAAKILKLGGLTHKDGTTQTLKSASVTEVESVGANLIPFPFLNKNGAGYTTTINGVTYTINTDRSISASGLPTGAATFVLVNALPVSPQKYFVSLTGSQNNLRLYIQLRDRNEEIVGRISTQTVASFDVGDYPTAETARVYLNYDTDTTVVSGTVFIFLCVGDKAKPYTPYFKSALYVPAAVVTLDGYGSGVDDQYNNHIDFEKKQYIKQVKRIVFDGNEKWTRYVTTGAPLFRYNLGDFVTIDRHIQSHFESNKQIALSNSQTGARLYRDSDSGKGVLNVRPTNYSTYGTVEKWKAQLAEWYAAGTPLELIYALDSPEITDISNILSADNYIEVEGGGTLTFKNEGELAVPSDVTFVTKEVSE